MPTTGESVGVIALLSLALKLMLLPSYQSAEFERQRVWLAVTHELPLREWYREEESGWPLSYPPVFAYFKWALAKLAEWVVEPEMLRIGAAAPSSEAMVTFERLSVIVSDSALLLGTLLYCTTWPSVTTTDMEWSRNKVVVVVALILFNPGLIMVDHINLHYTGFAVGILIICVAMLRRGDDLGDLLGAMTFVVLVSFDHGFVSVAPLFLVYLVRHFCCQARERPGPLCSRGLSVSSSDGFTSDDLPHGISAGSEEDDEAEEREPGRLARRARRARRLALRNGARSTAGDADANADADATTPVGKLLRQMRASTVSSAPSSPRAAAQPATAAGPAGPRHTRTRSDIPGGGVRLLEAYGRFKEDTSFKKLLQRPRAVSNLEIANTSRQLSLLRSLYLVAVLAGTLALVLLPLVWAEGELRAVVQLLYTRLMPPLEGASALRPYWAPNVWALYTGLDKVLATAASAWGLLAPELLEPMLSSAPGVDTSALLVLPVIRPWMCAASMALAMSPVLQQVWNFPHPPVLLPAFVYCMTCSFLFGFHVHEKSVLMIIVPLTLAACDSTMDARLYLLMAWIAHVSLIPILETPDLKTLKPVLLLLHCFASFIALDQYHIMARRARRIRPEPNGGGVWLWAGDRTYFHGLAATYFFAEVTYPVIPFFGPTVWPWLATVMERCSFLPLMAISLYCAAGMLHCWTLALQQVGRKIAVIESYQWSPRHSAASREPPSDGRRREVPQLSIF